MKKLALACAFTFSVAVAGAALTPAAAQPGWGGMDSRGLPDGSWRESCRNPQMRGGVFSAECRGSYDRWMRTSIDANSCRSGIANDQGRLVCDDRGGGWNSGGGNLPGGSWRQSCRNPTMRGSYLSAQCPDGRNRWQTATVDVRSCRSGRFANDQGRFFCEGGNGNGYPGNGGGWNPGNGGGGNLPGGSWRQSCRDGDVRGDRVVAQCRSGSGSWTGTSISLRECRSGRLGNNNGQLVCE